MKKALRIIAAIMLIAVFAVFALASGEEETKDQGSGEANASASSTVESTSDSDDDKIGDYSVVIDSCRVAKAKGYQEKDVVIVKYIFTNVNDDEPASYYLTFEDEVYQNGVGLNKAYFLDDSANYDSENQTKKIKKGASLEVEVAYELNDSATDIEVEVKELFSFNDTTLKKTFSIKDK